VADLRSARSQETVLSIIREVDADKSGKIEFQE
jgi:Ca2+-binding EF-hand superfamily protein